MQRTKATAALELRRRRADGRRRAELEIGQLPQHAEAAWVAWLTHRRRQAQALQCRQLTENLHRRHRHIQLLQRGRQWLQRASRKANGVQRTTILPRYHYSSSCTQDHCHALQRAVNVCYVKCTAICEQQQLFNSAPLGHRDRGTAARVRSCTARPQAGQPRHLAQGAGQRRTHEVFKAQVLQLPQRRDACWYAARVHAVWRCEIPTEVHAGEGGAPAICSLCLTLDACARRHDSGWVQDVWYRICA